MDSWETFDEILLPNREDFCCSLNIERIKMLVIEVQKRSLTNLK